MPGTALHPSIRRVVDAAARKGVTLEVTTFDESTHTAEEAATAVGAELGQIVKSLVFVVPTREGQQPLLCLVAGVLLLTLTLHASRGIARGHATLAKSMLVLP